MQKEINLFSDIKMEKKFNSQFVSYYIILQVINHALDSRLRQPGGF